jgi:D-glycero-D-manno-heptose 1,7-bisphosphate phosphatase
MEKSLKTEEALINGIFFCPHHPRGVIPEFTGDCDCRKPKTGLIKQACKRFDIDLPRSYVVGDRYMDIELAHRCNLKGILVKSGYGLGELKYVVPEKSLAPNHVARGLIDAVRWILERDEPIG